MYYILLIKSMRRLKIKNYYTIDELRKEIRKTKVHSKYFEWLNQRLAIFFVELNLKGFS